MFKVNNKDAIGVVLVSLLSTLNIFTPWAGVSFVNIEQVNAGRYRTKNSTNMCSLLTLTTVSIL